VCDENRMVIHMSSHREERINEEIKRELTSILRELKDPRMSGVVSILKTSTTKDLKFCKAYISVLGNDDKKADVKKGLDSAKGFIRKEVSARLALRVTPEFDFVVDNSLEEGDRILKMINDISKEW
jgi:ribosome-binding factor A